MTGQVDKRSGHSLRLVLSHSAPLGGQAIDVEVEAACGDKRSNAFLYGASKPGASFAGLHIGSTRDLGQGWSLTPSVHATTLLDKAMLAGAPRRTNFWAGIALNRKL